MIAKAAPSLSFSLYDRPASEYDDEQHLELLLPIYRVRMTRGHDDGFACVQNVFHTIDGDPAHAVKADDHCIAAGLMGADLLALVKGKKCNTKCGVLRKSLAHYLPCLIFNLLLQSKIFCFVDIFLSDYNIVLRSVILLLVQQLKILFV